MQKGFLKTKRQFKDIEADSEWWSLYRHENTGEFALFWDNDDESVYAKGSSVNGFYICAHTSVSIKINNKKTINLDTNSFYNLKDGETITHKKYIGFKKFTKIKQPSCSN